LSQINAEIAARFYKARMWLYVGTIEEVPTDRDLWLAVMNGDMHELVFPCRRRGKSWDDAKTQRPVEVHPTHLQEWPQK
jgi:hypothetical protein